MKKIGYDQFLVHENEKIQSLELWKSINYVLRIHSKAHQNQSNEQESTQKRRHAESTEGQKSCPKNSLACQFDKVFSGKANENEVINSLWGSFCPVLHFSENMQPSYRNVILLQCCKRNEILRIERVASALLTKMHTLLDPLPPNQSNKPSKKNRYRIDFSCLLIQQKKTFALCPEKGAGNSFVRKACDDLEKQHATSYAHWVSKLPKWKSISLLPDPDSFFRNVVQECTKRAEGDPTSHRIHESQTDKADNLIFVFHVYRADTKEMTAVFSVVDIQQPGFQTTEDLMMCIHGMQRSSESPYSAFHLFWHSKELNRLKLQSTEHQSQQTSGIMRIFRGFFRARRYEDSVRFQTDSIFHFFARYFQPLVGNQTFLVLNLEGNSNFQVQGTTVRVALGEGVHPLPTRALSTISPKKKGVLVKYVPIDMEPNVQYRLRKHPQRSKRQVMQTAPDPNNSAGRSKCCIAQTLQYQKQKKTGLMLRKFGISLLVQNLNITKQAAKQILQFLHQVDKYFCRETLSEHDTYVFHTRMQSHEENVTKSTSPSRINEETQALSHEVNDLKVHINYLTRKLEEHELRESIVSEKEAAIEQWELRRETLNNSVEELVSLLNTSGQKKLKSSRDGRLSHRNHGFDEYQSRLSRENAIGQFENDFGTEFGGDLNSLRSFENSSDAHWHFDESSQQSTSLSFCDTYAQSKSIRPFDSPVERKHLNFCTPRSRESALIVPDSASIETTMHRSNERLYGKDRPGDTDFLQIVDENRLLRSKVDILKAYTGQLESRYASSIADGITEEEPMGRQHVQLAPIVPTDKRSAEQDRTREIIPWCAMTGMQQIHRYVIFLQNSCKRVEKMSAELQKTVRETFLADLTRQQEIKNQKARKATEYSRKLASFRRSRRTEKSENKMAKGPTTESPKPLPEDNTQLRSLREHIKKLLLKLSSKDKENAQFRNKVQKLTRDLEVSSKKEINLRSQLDTIGQRNQLLTKDFNTFKKNLRKVDKETEKIQSQNRILKDQLEKIEKTRVDVNYRTTKWSQQERLFASINRQAVPSRYSGLTAPKIESFNDSRDSDDQSNSTFMSLRAIDEISVCSMTISQTSSTVRTGVYLTVPKLSLDRVQGGNVDAS
ncbi:hypothetical protein XU18_0272 [Perkinsela sp. CCAP 1560/4]|nr:hypothetical protein XU18_0272 [Perkinsela sp. CCAP 1560/4]|eukprot:KNH09587.1 hypothetical protein XU18_0272 [Perkinsela sp. CCAP 1560/4]